jgi:hypothetical protein
VSIRPAYALLAASACIALLVFAAPYVLRTEAAMLEFRGEDAVPRLFVQFRLQTDASNVQLAGSFTNWELAYQLHQIAPGVWTITVPLPQGVHRHALGNAGADSGPAARASIVVERCFSGVLQRQRYLHRAYIQPYTRLCASSGTRREPSPDHFIAQEQSP